MTVIRPNSVSGITSITAQANEINFFRSNGTLAGLQLNGVNFNTTTGVSTFNNLDVGGVLTYQDVTNVDSVGIITARSNIDCNGDLDVDGHTNLDNVSIAGVSTFTGNVIVDSGTVRCNDGFSSDVDLIFNADANNNGTGSIIFKESGSETVRIDPNGYLIAKADIRLRRTASDNGALYFGDTNNNYIFGSDADDVITFATGGLERLRITSGGKVKISNHGTNNLRSLSVLAPKTQIQWGTGEDVGGFLMSENNGQFGLSGGGYWTGSNWVATHTGSAQIRHDGVGDMVFCTNASLTSGNNFVPAERLRITSGGQVRIANTNLATNTRADNLIVGTTSGHTGITIFSGTGETGNIYFADTSTSGVGNRMGTITYDHSENYMRLSTSGNQERLRITSTGILNAPSQAGFYARMNANKNDKTGDGTYYTVEFDTDSGSICYDQHNTFSTSTGLYQIPTGGDGVYQFTTAVCLSTDVYGRQGEGWFLTNTGLRIFFDRRYFQSVTGTITGFYGSCIAKMTAGQTMGVQIFVNGGAKNVDVFGAGAGDHVTWFSGRKIA